MRGTVYVLMTVLNGHKNILSVWASKAEAEKAMALVIEHGGKDDAYVLEMPVWDKVEIGRTYV